MLYRDFIITYDPPPIGTRRCDWQYAHKDYDGTEDGEDRRIGFAASEYDCRTLIDNWYIENLEIRHRHLLEAVAFIFSSCESIEGAKKTATFALARDRELTP